MCQDIPGRLWLLVVCLRSNLKWGLYVVDATHISIHTKYHDNTSPGWGIKLCTLTWLECRYFQHDCQVSVWCHLYIQTRHNPLFVDGFQYEVVSLYYLQMSHLYWKGLWQRVLHWLSSVWHASWWIIIFNKL